MDATNLALSIDAQVGDDLEVTLSAVYGSQTNTANLDVATCSAGGAVINYFSSQSSAPSTLGWPAWYNNGVAWQAIAASALYTVTAADLITYFTVPGVVLLKLRGQSTGGTRQLYAGSLQIPLLMHVKNLGPRNTPGFNAS